MVKPVLELVANHLKIIISPLARYLKDRCGLDTDHVANLEEANYRSNQEEAIQACRVICPWSKLKLIEGDLRPTDLVHMAERGRPGP